MNQNQIWHELMCHLYSNEEGVLDLPSCSEVEKDLDALGIEITYEGIRSDVDAFVGLTFNAQKALEVIS